MNTELLNKTLIGRDFLRLKDNKQPSTDEFLDWRNELVKLKCLKKYPAEWYQLEIEATDEILKFLNGETVKLWEPCPKCGCIKSHPFEDNRLICNICAHIWQGE